MPELESSFFGHGAILEGFRQCVARGRLGSSYLFVGPPGVGKKTFALRLAQGLLCENAASPVDPCQECAECHRIRAASHPDVVVIERPRDRAFIPLELLVGDRDHRSTEGFCHWVSLAPQSNRYKVGIIDDADYLNTEGANSLLKTLEEPPSRSVLILIATSEQRQLPTIRSRCQIVRFGGLREADLSRLLLQHGFCSDVEQAQLAAAAAEGSLEMAHFACDSDWSDMRDQVWSGLAGLPHSRWELVEQIQQYLDAAGSESSEKRRAVRNVLNWSVQFWRAALRASQHSIAAESPPALAELVSNTARRMGAVDALSNCLERSIDGLAQIDNNVIVAGFIDVWIDDLAQCL